VARGLTDVAQESLYRNVTIKGWGKTLKMLSFLRTLLERPGLARKVKNLELWSCAMGASVESGGSLPINLDGLHNKIKDAVKDGRHEVTETWAESLEKHLDSAYAALILLVLPNMESLCLLNQYIVSFSTSIPGFLTHGESLAGGNVRFQTIRNLDIPFEYMALLRPHCPKLNSLALDEVTLAGLLSLQDSPLLTGESELRKLELRISIGEESTSPNDWIDGLFYISQALNSPSVDHLTLFFTDAAEHRHGHYDFTFQLAYCAWTRIASLKIHNLNVECCRMFEGGALQFENLAHVSLPFDALVTTLANHMKRPICNDMGIWRQTGFTCALGALPSSLETLAVEDFTREFVPWLKCFAEWAHLYPNLHRITFIERNLAAPFCDDEIKYYFDFVPEVSLEHEICSLEQEFANLGIILTIDTLTAL
jgi:hypothetical protein